MKIKWVCKIHCHANRGPHYIGAVLISKCSINIWMSRVAKWKTGCVTVDLAKSKPPDEHTYKSKPLEVSAEIDVPHLIPPGTLMRPIGKFPVDKQMRVVVVCYRGMPNWVVPTESEISPYMLIGKEDVSLQVKGKESYLCCAFSTYWFQTKLYPCICPVTVRTTSQTLKTQVPMPQCSKFCSEKNGLVVLNMPHHNISCVLFPSHSF